MIDAPHLAELLKPAPLIHDVEPEQSGVELTEDEERELAELLEEE